MTRYTVVWDTEVESRFINLWVAGDSEIRSILTEVANWVDTNLAVDADQTGHELPDLSARILAVPVSSARVSVLYQVVPEDRQVRVIRLIFRK